MMLRCSAATIALLRANPFVCFGGALVAAAAAMGLRLSLEGWLGPGWPAFITFYPMVMAVALLAGFWPGMATTGASTVIAAYGIMPPIGQFFVSSPVDRMALVFFFAMGLFMSLAAELYRRSRSKAAAYDREAASYEKQLALRESEERFRAMANAMPQLSWIARPDGHIFWYNERWYEYTGTTPEQMAGWGWQCVHDTAELPKVLERWKASIATGDPFEMTFPLRGVDARFRRFLTRAIPLKDASGRVVQWFGTNTDVEELTLAENALRKSEERYHSLFETLIEGFCIIEMIFDPEGKPVDYRFLEINPAFERQTGLHNAQGKLMRDLAPDNEAHWFEIYGKVAMSGEPARFVNEAKALRRWYDVSAYRVGGADSRKVAILFNDITERKQAEQKVWDAMLEAERADNAKSRFLAAASHDLRQPLSALGIYLRVLAGKVAPAEQKIVASMKECVAGLSGLLKDLLDLSKLSAEVVKLNVDDFPVAALFDDMLSMHRPVAESRGLRLRCVPAELTVRTDRMLLQRIVGNFIDNALRYTVRGGIVVGCRRRQGKVFVEVWDSGIGIPADKREVIFEEFRQLGDEARNRGSGLGLAIAAKAATLLGLEIQLRSRLGSGSVFAIEIPLGQAKTLPALPVRHAAYRRLRVALVEDYRPVREALTTALQEAGHQVVCATGVDEIHAALGGVAPDVVVTDYRLPKGTTGFDVISTLKASFGATLPAIIISGDTDPLLLRNMADHGIVVLHKPIDLEELQAHLDDITSPVVATLI